MVVALLQNLGSNIAPNLCFLPVGQMAMTGKLCACQVGMASCAGLQRWQTQDWPATGPAPDLWRCGRTIAIFDNPGINASTIKCLDNLRSDWRLLGQEAG